MSSPAPDDSPAVDDTRTLYDLVLPGSHDSGAYRIPLRNTTPAGAPIALSVPPLRFFLRRTLSDFSKTHDGPLLAQLRAGSRYQDLRVSRVVRPRLMAKLPPPGEEDEFWLVHGAVACVPLGEALAGMRTFADEVAANGEVAPVVSVARLLGQGWDKEGHKALAARFVEALGRENIYDGNVAGLKSTPYAKLPAHVVAGVPGLSGLNDIGEQFGSDVWINTYNLDEKTAGLEKQVREIKPRTERNNLYVLGWTVTPQPTDIAKRIVSFGICRPSLETEAKRVCSLS
jgi:hypothetical protein